MISRQIPVNRVGLTHASSVIAVLNCSNEELATDTKELLPLNDIALPYFPVVVQDAPPCNVPVWVLPEASFTMLPVPSLKLYAATKPGSGGVAVGVGVGVGAGVGVGVALLVPL